MSTLVTAHQIVCVGRNNELFKSGTAAMNELNIIENAAMVINPNGDIAAIGPEAEIRKQYQEHTFENTYDFPTKSIIPGLVDAHTHPVWSGDRVNEFKMKLAGATYMDIHAMGGGIGYTVRCTTESSEDELLTLFLERLNSMLSTGTVLVEAKSGYGLHLDTEVKMLKVIEQAKKQHPVEIVSNYCGAHSVPKGSTADAAADDIISKQIPTIAAMCRSGELTVEQIDVFCEKGVFSTDLSKKILVEGQKHGFAVNFHGDELNYTGSCEMGAAIGASAISHVECVSDEGVKAMAEKQVAAVLLPTTAYVLRIHPPPARKLVDEGVIVALGSDFNPNAYCSSMPHVMNLACVMMRMTVNEALVAATLNAAKALNKSDKYGSLEVGKRGDFVVVDADKWEHIVYQMGTAAVKSVFKGGKLVYSK